MDKEMYIAVLIDVVGSRKLDPAKREDVQKALRRGIDNVNCFLRGKYLMGQDKYAAFEFSAGDSVMGLVKTTADAAVALNLILGEIAGVHPAYAVLGRGEWTLRMEGRGANEQDGPCFWEARHCLEYIKDAPCTFAIGQDNKCMEDIEALNNAADEFGWEDYDDITPAYPCIKRVWDQYRILD